MGSPCADTFFCFCFCNINDKTCLTRFIMKVACDILLKKMLPKQKLMCSLTVTTTSLISTKKKGWRLEPSRTFQKARGARTNSERKVFLQCDYTFEKGCARVNNVYPSSRTHFIRFTMRCHSVKGAHSNLTGDFFFL